ncbi:MAG: hypothetical protein HQ498_14305 [Pseudohongiella sp.]|nr:hypothetical protein [Pseudohongiella sp.]
MNRKLLILLFGLPSCLLAAASAPDPLFQSSEIIDITLTAPFSLIDDERDKEKEYEGSLSYTDAVGEQVRLDVGLQVRGNWRLRKDNCTYSQLWVDFKRGQVAGTIFENQNRLKLVVQCRRPDRYAELIVKEQQAYQIFAELSEYNFDTRLVNVSYVDSEREDSSRTQLAFFIEHQNRLQARFGMEEVELSSIPNEQLNASQASLVALFMYLLGNTDYSIAQAAEGEECCHNAKLLLSEAGDYFAIPYDFDASGFVNAPYAAEPAPAMNIRSNRQRRYRGYCKHNDALPSAMRIMLEARANIAAIVGDASRVSARTANSSSKYVQELFEVLADQRSFDRAIIGDCRGQ